MDPPTPNRKSKLRGSNDSSSKKTTQQQKDQQRSSPLRYRCSSFSSSSSSSSSSSPIPSSPQSILPSPFQQHDFHFWEYVKVEMLGVGEPGKLEPPNLAKANIKNFFLVPFQLEKLITLGNIISLDAFLYVLTYLPIRVAFSCLLLVKETFIYVVPLILPSLLIGNWKQKDHKGHSKSVRLHRTNLYDLMRGFILVTGYFALCKINMSQLYHFIRGQNMIKLYVLTSMMEVTDTLLSSFGQDVFDSLYSHVRTDPTSLSIFFPFAVVTIYVIIHGALYFLHVATLTVVINSADSTLVTVLILNNFAELRGYVFKKYDRFYLFQLACDDITERFRVLLFIFLIMMIALAQAGTTWLDALPSLIRVAVMMVAGEMLADSMKHAFINKFNKIEATSYQDYASILRGDFISNQKDRIILDHTYSVTRRIGLSQIPLGCVCLRCLNLAISAPAVQSYFKNLEKVSYTVGHWYLWYPMLIALHWMCLFVVLLCIKLFLGVGLFLYARNVNSEEMLELTREAEMGMGSGRLRSNSVIQKERREYMSELAHINRYTVHKGRIV